LVLPSLLNKKSAQDRGKRKVEKKKPPPQKKKNHPPPTSPPLLGRRGGGETGGPLDPNPVYNRSRGRKRGKGEGKPSSVTGTNPEGRYTLSLLLRRKKEGELVC